MGDAETPAPHEQSDVDAVAAAVLAVPGVHSLHAGVLGEVATYLPGRRVGGVRLNHPGAEVHLVVAWGSPVARTADEVRAVVRELTGGPVEVTVEDVAPRGAAAPEHDGAHDGAADA